MAWTTPRTWVAAEVVTASNMNTHVRDNLAYLKGILDGTVAGNLVVTGNITASGYLSANDLYGSGDLTVSGSTTLADLDVNATLDVVSDLTVSGDTVIVGTLTVGGRAIKGSAGARVYHNAAQTITTATTTVLAFNQERYDDNAFHNTVTNNSRLTVPADMGGKYHITGSVSWGPVADATYRAILIRLNGATTLARVVGPGLNSASFGTDQMVSTVYELAAGDYVELLVRHERGSNLDVTVTANMSPEFAIAAV